MDPTRASGQNSCAVAEADHAHPAKQPIEIIEQCPDQVAPNELPTEVLCHIFKLCDAGEVKFPPKDDGNIFTISRVCSRWRHIALSSPELWSGLSIDFKSGAYDDLPIARQWLSRAGSIPISIHGRWPPLARYYWGYQPHAHIGLWGDSLLRDLLPHFRFRKLFLSLHAPNRGQVAQLKEVLHESKMTLEELNLQLTRAGYGTYRHFRPIHPEDVFPSLKRLVCTGGLFDDHIFDAIVSWDRLVHLEFDTNVPVSRCVAILSQCLVLDFCCIEIGGLQSTSDTNFSFPRLVLPALRTLHLTICGQAGRKLIGALSLPMLENFTLNPPYSGTVELNTSDICDMIRRSDGMRRLKTIGLRLSQTPFDAGQILACAPPCLGEIYIGCDILDEESILRLSTGELGPRLETICFHGIHNADQMLRMVEVRYQTARDSSPVDGITPFHFVYIRCLPENATHADIGALQSRCDALAKSLGNIKELKLGRRLNDI